jgi:hypothetical protein
MNKGAKNESLKVSSSIPVLVVVFFIFILKVKLGNACDKALGHASNNLNSGTPTGREG